MWGGGVGGLQVCHRCNNNFMGRTGMKVYKPKKPHKWSLNCWNVPESCTSYVWNAKLYQGKRNNETEVGMYKVFSLRVCATHCLIRGHRIYTWNAELYQDKWNNETEVGMYKALGTCMCQPLLYLYGQPVLLARTVSWPYGPSYWNMRYIACQSHRYPTCNQNNLRSAHDGDLMFLSLYDKRQVNVMTS